MERRPMVARFLLRKQKVGAIHKMLNDLPGGAAVSYDTVRRDIAALEKAWHDDLVTDPIAMKSRELAENEAAEAECGAMYTKTSEQRWLTELRLWKERKAKLMGLDAVQVFRAEVSAPGGGPVQAQVGIEVLFGDPAVRRLIDQLAEHLEGQSSGDSQ